MDQNPQNRILREKKKNSPPFFKQQKMGEMQEGVLKLTIHYSCRKIFMVTSSKSERSYVSLTRFTEYFLEIGIGWITVTEAPMTNLIAAFMCFVVERGVKTHPPELAKILGEAGEDGTLPIKTMPVKQQRNAQILRAPAGGR